MDNLEYRAGVKYGGKLLVDMTAGELIEALIATNALYLYAVKQINDLKKALPV